MSRVTERRNPASRGIDEKSIHEILEVINAEDAKIAEAIHQQLPGIEKAVERIVSTIKSGGCVYLAGAGSSGRLCVLEAAEIPPTYGLSPDRIKALIAGGVPAIVGSVEAAEDDRVNGGMDIAGLDVGDSDLVIGVAASGSTPYVLGVMEKARELGAFTVGFSCNKDTPLCRLAEIAIEVVVGPEVVSGSTRMKAGSTQKMVLNMMTTTAMIRLGLVYDGWMVGLQATNSKLKERSKRIVAEITGAGDADAGEALRAAGWDVRVAIVLLLTDLSPDEAVEALKSRSLRQIISPGGTG
ncbi:N-acetylmuramic acid 6-phosphate etherase [Candidatus Bathyarchaeota archaeon]|nr:N-acetylmuramic acid 6-phosphate etherase [Candidatus Bathyarchaeota archaeon]